MIDVVLGSFLLVAGLLTVLCAVATPARRARAGAGGALHPAYLLVLIMPTAAILFLGAFGHMVGGLSALAMVPFVLVTLRHRRRLAAMPEGQLSPQMQWMRSQDRFPFALDPRNAARWARGGVEHIWGREARRRHREWERAQGLR